MKILFIGGTGIISSACSTLAVSKGYELYHLNRGKSTDIRKIDGVKTLVADIRNLEATRKILDGYYFDVVVDWIAFEPEHIQNDINLFTDKTDQFVFISSASVYQTPPQNLPVTENTSLGNPFWQYARNKIACENALRQAYKNNKFPYTIVRPSHTYDKTLLPIEGGYTVLQRMVRKQPIVIHGDGTSIWTLTHHQDFAVGLVGLLGKKEAIDEVYHITSDEWLSWNSIYTSITNAMDVDLSIVHIPSDIIAKYDQKIGDSLLGDKAHSMIFDNTKIKKMVPAYNAKIAFNHGVKEIAKWYQENDNLYEIDMQLNTVFDQMIQDYTK